MLLQQIINGLTIGATYALVAVGFSMVYSVLELANFANGAFYVFAPYVVVLLYASMGWGFIPAFLIAILATGVLGALMDRFVLTTIRNHKAQTSSSMVATLGVSTVIINGLIAVFGSATKSLPNAVNIGRIHIGNAIMTGNQLVIIVMSLIIMAVLSVIVYKTKLGSAMRSIAQNPVASRMMGVNVNRIITITFFIGSASAAIAGTMVAMYYGSVDTTLYTSVSVKTFASAILGGIGSVPGAMLGGVIIGMLETFVAGYWTSAYKDMIAFIIIIAFLIFKPNGLLGHRKLNKV